MLSMHLKTNNNYFAQYVYINKEKIYLIRIVLFVFIVRWIERKKSRMKIYLPFQYKFMVYLTPKNVTRDSIL